MTRSIVSLLMLLCPLALAAQDEAEIEIQQSLYLNIKGHRTLVMRLQPRQEFQGTAVTRDGNVFLSYCLPISEAVTDLAIYDVKLKKLRRIAEIGGTGSTTFAYHPANDLIVFDWADGVYILPLDVLRKEPIEPGPDRFRALLTRVAACQSCWSPSWTRDGHIQYREYDEHGELHERTVAVPELRHPGQPDTHSQSCVRLSGIVRSHREPGLPSDDQPPNKVRWVFVYTLELVKPRTATELLLPPAENEQPHARLHLWCDLAVYPDCESHLRESVGRRVTMDGWADRDFSPGHYPPVTLWIRAITR